ncbi:MAG: hypothetical protein GY820_31915 [Gammaproteobacteria bacterium]|nr:hypothetical protein [Gammaproteobacteria bacterium]
MIRDLDSIDPHHRLTQEKSFGSVTDRHTDRQRLVCGPISIGKSLAARGRAAKKLARSAEPLFILECMMWGGFLPKIKKFDIVIESEKYTRSAALQKGFTFLKD